MGAERSRIWMPLDNAALIFPAIRRRNWNNVFRQSVTLKEDVDPALLQQAGSVAHGSALLSKKIEALYHNRGKGATLPRFCG